MGPAVVKHGSLMTMFYWLGIHGNVVANMSQVSAGESFCHPKYAKVLSYIVPFERIGMDLVRPLDSTAQEHLFVLGLLDHSLLYAEAHCVGDYICSTY